MFYNNAAFNQDISMRDVHLVNDMTYMLRNAGAFNQDLSTWDVRNLQSADNMLENTALSTYNYNALLDQRSKQNVKSWVNFAASPTQYGGCEVNAAAGIAGRALLQGKVWNIYDGGLAGCVRPFITTWKTDNTDSYSSNATSIKIPVYPNITGYNFTIDWGDGTTGAYSGANPVVTHDYGIAGTYTVKIYGDFPRIYFNNSAARDFLKILSVDQWGDVQWTSMERAFWGCENLAILANDTPKMSNVTSMQYMFRGATNLTGNFSGWDTSNVTRTDYMFRDATNFNQNINSWDVSKVTTMNGMFRGATNFNQPLDQWNVGKVWDFNQMFSQATNFNQPLDMWDMSSATTIGSMFSQAYNFNQPLNSWDTSKVTSMGNIFQMARAFNQPLNNWDTSKVTDMLSMFLGAFKFDQDLSSWVVTGVASMRYMFDSTALSTYNYNAILNSRSQQNVKS